MPICFEQDVAGQLVVELEKCKILENMYQIVTAQKDEQGRIIVDLKLINTKKQELLFEAQKTIDRLEELHDLAEEMCEQKIKDVKPSLFKEIGKSAVSIIVGILIAIILL